MKDSLTASESWIRGFYIVLFTIIYSVAEIVLVAIVIFQFLMTLLTRQTNDRLLDLGDDLSIFQYQILQFATYNSDEKPFPFGPWPYGTGGPSDAGSPPEQARRTSSDTQTHPDNTTPGDDLKGEGPEGTSRH
ncbi:MAG: DUF4389 domain-containing protein [Proteobacteria bacterium]|nr:DUF4389 domain-containing protein [Pseudomonadota bacterium]